MKRRSLIGIGAASAALAAFFLHPRKGRARREAVRRGGERLMQRGAEAANLVGVSRHGARRATELRLQVEDALIDALGGEALALRVAVDKAGITVRGEVASLEHISRASRVIDRFRGEAEVVNLVRLRPTPASSGKPAG